MPRKWILLIDDDARLRGLWAEMLEAVGYAVVGAGDGLTANELMRDLFPDLIILDLRMPHLSGWQFLESARARPWQNIPVLIVSGYLDDRQPESIAGGLNIVGKLAKPLTPQELLAKVQEILGPSPSPAPPPSDAAQKENGSP